MTGQTIPHYRIFSQIGGCGMGVVREAEDLKVHRHVALRFLAGELAAVPPVSPRLGSSLYAKAREVL
jgi:hypothetical protein